MPVFIFPKTRRWFLRRDSKDSHCNYDSICCVLYNLAASIWTASVSCWSSLVQLSHTTSAYSSVRLIKQKYIFSKLDLLKTKLSVRRIPILCQALLSVSLIWSFNLTSSDSVKPRCLWLFTDGIVVVSIRSGGWSTFFENSTDSVLVWLKVMSNVLDQRCIVLKSQFLLRCLVNPR